MTTREQRQQMYENTYKSKNPEEAKAAYETWAPHYEAQMKDLQWQAPELCADLLVTHLLAQCEKQSPQTVSLAEFKVLDVGAGTGLVGEALTRLGVQQIDAQDLSGDMLAQSDHKKIYQRLFEESAEDMQQVAVDSYDALICVGALNFGHISPKAFSEFIRVVKPGGLIAFTTREDFYQQDSAKVQNTLSDNKSWQLLEARVIPTAVNDMQHRHWCYAVV